MFRTNAIIVLSVTALSLPAHSESLKTCLLSGGKTLHQSSESFLQGTRDTPHNFMRPSNLKWELPVIATAGVLIATADQPVREHPPSRDISDASDAASNYLLGAEVGAAFFTYAIGCANSNDHPRDAGLQAITAMGF